MSRRAGTAAPRASGSGGARAGGGDSAAMDALIKDRFAQLDPANLNQPLDRTTAVSSLRTLIQEVMSLGQQYKKALDAFNDAAADMAECGADEEVAKADIHVRDLISLQAQADFRKAVLEEMREQAGRGNALSGLEKLYADEVKTRREEWEAKTARQKFGKSEAYRLFRERVWEGGDHEEAMPSIKHYLPLEEGEVEADSDDDLEVGGGRAADFKCPLCITYLKSPVKSTVCIHAFCKACFDDYWAQNRGAATVACPVTGCSKHLTRTSVVLDKSLAHRVQQHQRQQEARRTQQEEDYSSDEDMDDVEDATQDRKPGTAKAKGSRPAATQPRGTQKSTQRKRIVVEDSDEDD